MPRAEIWNVDANLISHPVLADSNGALLIGNLTNAPVIASTGNVSTPAAATAAVVTYAAIAGLRHVITGVGWSYSGGIPGVGANLNIQDGAGNVVFSWDITESGPGFVLFPPALKQSAVNTSLIITLTSGGAGVTGKLCILGHWTEA